MATNEVKITVSRGAISSPPPPKPTPLPPIAIVLTPEQRRALVEKFALPFGLSIEDTSAFLLEQAMAAPEPAHAWMVAKCRAAGKQQQPKASDAFEAWGDAVRERTLTENAPAFDLAASFDRYLAARTAAKR